MTVQDIRIRDLQSAPVGDAAAILCDLDGCLIADGRPLPGAAGFLDAHRDTLWIVSNNSSDTARSLSARLADQGLAVGPDRIFLAGEQSLHRVARQRPGAAVSLFMAAPLRELGAQIGLRNGTAAPDLVVLGRDEEFSLRDLRSVLTAVSRGAELVASNPDRSHPDADGLPVPETGAVLSALQACLPELTYTTLGKPDPTLLQLALERAGVPPSEAVLIGDNRETDGAAAARVGLRFILLDRARGTVGSAA